MSAAEEGRQEQSQQQANQPPSSAEIDAAKKLIREFMGTWPDAWSRRSESGQRQLAKARQHADGLRWLLDHTENEYMRVATFRLLLESRPDCFPNDILHALDNTSARIRMQATGRLAMALSGRALVEKYVELLRDPWHGVRHTAAAGLLRHPSETAIEPLVERLDDLSMGVRFSAAHTLLSWDTPEARAALRRAAESENIAIAGTVAAASTLWASEPADLPRLHAYLKRELPRLTKPPDYNYGYVKELIKLIGEHGDESSLPVLNAGTQHKHRGVRQAVQEAIERVRSRTSEAGDAGPEAASQEP